MRLLFAQDYIAVIPMQLYYIIYLVETLVTAMLVFTT